MNTTFDRISFRLPMIIAAGLVALSTGSGCGSGAVAEGTYPGAFECTDLDADVAELRLAGDGSELAFTPSAAAAGIFVAAPLDDLSNDDGTVSFSVTFHDVEGEETPLDFAFTLIEEDDALRGTGTLVTPTGEQDCEAEFLF